MKSSLLVVGIASVMVGGCGLFTPKIEALDDASVGTTLPVLSVIEESPLVWRTAILSKCAVDVKSVRTAEAATALVALGEVFLSKFIDYGVHAFAESVKQAAALDKDGITFAASGADYLYSSTVSWEGELRTPAPDAPTIVHTPNSCLVVARGRARQVGESAVPWCLDGQNADPCASPERKAHFDAVATELDLDKPSFYAEVRLRPAASRDAIQGELSYLYYPVFLTERKQDSRDLLITASLLEPAATPRGGTVVSVYSFALKDIRPPFHQMGASSLATAVAGWSPLPAPPTKETMVALARAKQVAANLTRLETSLVGSRDESVEYSTQPVPLPDGPAKPVWSTSFSSKPVSIVASVQETGDVNKFLQYMATWLGTEAAQQAIATPIKNVVLPSKREAAEAAEEAAEAAEATAAAALATAFNSAIDGYLTADKLYEKFCEANPGPFVGSLETEVQTLHLAVARAVDKVHSAAGAASISEAAYPVPVTLPAANCGL